MVLIADSGSTTTTWCVMARGSESVCFDSDGLNPFFVDADRIQNIVVSALPEGIDRNAVKEVHFYGAGCIGARTDVVSNAMNAAFPGAASYTYVDLLGAARGLLGSRAGFAAILGTGTNSCMYNGHNIAHHIESLGYILGDEGSGSAIGRRLLGDFLRGYMPTDIRDEFMEAYQLRTDDVLTRVYSQPWANRYCAGFSRFITPLRLKNGYCDGVVRQCFNDFFQNIVSRYPGYQEHTFNCVGSVAYAFQDVLTEVAETYGMGRGSIAASPMEGLVEFHRMIVPRRGL